MRAELEGWRKYYGRESKWNSNFYHSLFAASLVSSALAAFFSGAGVRLRRRRDRPAAPDPAGTSTSVARAAGSRAPDAGAILALLAGIITAFNAAYRYDARWYANRVARNKLDQLWIDSYDPRSSVEEIRTQLKATLDEANGAVLGGSGH